MVAGFPQLAEDLDGMREPRGERVVGVDQEQRRVGIDLGVGSERRQFVGKAHDPRVGVCASHGDAVQPPGQHIRSGVCPTQESRTRSCEASVRPLGASEAELHDVVIAGRQANARRFGCHQGGVVQAVEHGGFYELCFCQSAFDPEGRFVRKHERTLRYGVNVDLWLEAAKILKKGAVE